MGRTAADTVTKALLSNIHRKLQEAASIAKAAEVCAETGNVQTAVKMVVDIEDPTHQPAECWAPRFSSAMSYWTNDRIKASCDSDAFLWNRKADCGKCRLNHSGTFARFIV